jgi:hypothetical protein
LLRRAARSAALGGLVAVKDLRVDADRSGPAEGVLFALNMALFTEAGDVHDAASITAWLREVGLERPETLDLQSAPDAHLVVAAASLPTKTHPDVPATHAP